MKRKILTLMISVLVTINLFSFSACGAEQIAELEKQNEALQKRIDALEQQNVQAKTEKDVLQGQLDDLNTQMAEKSSEIELLKEVIEREEVYGPPLEYGFEFAPQNRSRGIEHFAIKSDRCKFDIDDVTFTFYYGTDFIENDLKTKDSDSYKIIVRSPKQFTLKHIEGNYYSEENQVEMIFHEDGKRVKGVKYKQWEKVTLPVELFKEERDSIKIGLQIEKEGSGIFSYLYIYYDKLENNKVRLSMDGWWSD